MRVCSHDVAFVEWEVSMVGSKRAGVSLLHRRPRTGERYGKSEIWRAVELECRHRFLALTGREWGTADEELFRAPPTNALARRREQQAVGLISELQAIMGRLDKFCDGFKPGEPIGPISIALKAFMDQRELRLYLRSPFLTINPRTLIYSHIPEESRSHIASLLGRGFVAWQFLRSPASPKRDARWVPSPSEFAVISLLMGNRPLIPGELWRAGPPDGKRGPTVADVIGLEANVFRQTLRRLRSVPELRPNARTTVSRLPKRA
jgi:hypothetical protein